MTSNCAELYAASDMYQLLSAFMFRTERGLTDALAGGGIAADVNGILDDLGFEGEAAASLSAGFAPSAVCGRLGEEELFHDVRRDFTHLFSNPSFSVVRIHESEFLGEVEGKNARNLSLNAIARDVKERYARFDGSVMGDMADQADHMGLELRYMQILRNAEAAALEGGEADDAALIAAEAADFLEKHLAAWAPAFFDRVKSEAHTGAYRALGVLGRAFMASELAD